MIFQCKRIIKSSDEKSDEASLHQGLKKAVEHFLCGNPAFFASKKPRISFMAVAKNLKAFSALVSLRFIRFLTCLSFMRLPWGKFVDIIEE